MRKWKETKSRRKIIIFFYYKQIKLRTRNIRILNLPREMLQIAKKVKDYRSDLVTI